MVTAVASEVIFLDDNPIAVVDQNGDLWRLNRGKFNPMKGGALGLGKKGIVKRKYRAQPRGANGKFLKGAGPGVGAVATAVASGVDSLGKTATGIGSLIVNENRRKMEQKNRENKRKREEFQKAVTLQLYRRAECAGKQYAAYKFAREHFPDNTPKYKLVNHRTIREACINWWRSLAWEGQELTEGIVKFACDEFDTGFVNGTATLQQVNHWKAWEIKHLANVLENASRSQAHDIMSECGGKNYWKEGLKQIYWKRDI